MDKPVNLSVEIPDEGQVSTKPEEKNNWSEKKRETDHHSS